MSTIILVISIPMLCLITIYRVWLNAKVYRVKYDYHEPAIYYRTEYNIDEIDKANEAGVFFLFCFFTLIWINPNAKYRSLALKSNLVFFLSLIPLSASFYAFYLMGLFQK